MATAEIIKMTLPRSVGLEGGHGGIPEITPEMVSAAIGSGKLSDGASLYCQYRHQHQEHLKGMVWRWVYFNHCHEWMINESWTCRANVVWRMPKVALEEVMSDSICPLCRGTGVLIIEGKECGKCHGIGKKRPSNRSIAKQLGVNKDWFYQGGDLYSRYTRTLNVYYGYESQLHRAIQKL